MSTVEEIKSRLETNLHPTLLEVIDDSAAHHGHAGIRDLPEAGHYRVIIACEAFAGKNRVAQHRLVYGLLQDLMPHRIHALVVEVQ